MKTTLITLLASLLFLVGSGQTTIYDVRAKQSRPLTRETISKAKTLGDLIPGFPESWISSYVLIEISASYAGKVRKTTALTDVLTTEQKNMLNAVELGTDVTINVSYKYDNISLIENENNQIHVVMAVVPETEAEYMGGRVELNNYLKKNVTDPLSLLAPKKSQDGVVVFIVNEEGEIVNAKLTASCGDPKADKLFIEAINGMPKWKPAQNSKGEKVKQEFVFYLGSGGGC